MAAYNNNTRQEVKIMALPIHLAACRPAMLVGSILVATIVSQVGYAQEGKPQTGVDLKGGAVPVGPEVKTKFRGVEYGARIVDGGLVFNPLGDLRFNGLIRGKQGVTDNPSWVVKSRIDRVRTNCRILDADPPSYLVDGDVEFAVGKPIFIGPGAKVENVATSRAAIHVPSPSGGEPTDLGFGEVLEVDEGGIVKKTRLPNPR